MWNSVASIPKTLKHRYRCWKSLAILLLYFDIAYLSQLWYNINFDRFPSKQLSSIVRLFDWLAFQPHFFFVSPLLGKVSHGTTTRSSRDSWNIGRRLTGPSLASLINRGTHDAMRLRKKAQRARHGTRRKRALRVGVATAGIETGQLDKSADNTIRPIINLIAIFDRYRKPPTLGLGAKSSRVTKRRWCDNHCNPPSYLRHREIMSGADINCDAILIILLNVVCTRNLSTTKYDTFCWKTPWRIRWSRNLKITSSVAIISNVKCGCKFERQNINRTIWQCSLFYFQQFVLL